MTHSDIETNLIKYFLPMADETDNQERLKQLETMPVGRLLWTYSLPAVVGMIVMSLYNVIDRIFIGRGVGPDAISGLAITFPVMNLATALGVLVGAGASARVSILLGRRDRHGASLVLGNSLVLIILNATIYISIFGIFIDPILRAFGASDATLPYARDFILYLLPGLLMTNLAFSFNNIMRASGYPRRAMLTMMLGAGINIALAPIFIFVFGMGIKGAAIATDIAMTASAAFVMVHFFRRDVTLHFVKGIYRLRLAVVMSIVAIGAAPALVNAAACFINVLINNSLYTYGGDMAVGAAGIFSTYTSLLVTVVLGICQGMQPIIGYNYGAGHYSRLRRTFWLAAGVSTVICAGGEIVAMIFPSAIATAFTSDDTMISLTSTALTTAMLVFGVVGFQIVSTTFFQSIGCAGKSIFLSLTRQVIFLIPLLMILPSQFGLKGVWMSFPSSDALATLVTAAMIIWQLRQIGRMNQRPR